MIESIQAHFVHLAEAVAVSEFWQKQCIVNAEQEHRQQIAAIQQQYQQDLANADAAYAPAPPEHQRRLTASKSQYEQVSNEILATYNTAWQGIDSARQHLLDTVNFLTKAWDDPVWNDWQPQQNQTLPEVVRFGQLRMTGQRRS